MSSETPSPGLRARSAGIAAGAVLTAVAAVALLGRMFAHAAYLHDTESLMIPTVGRELLHGHTADWIHYQYEVYQGAILVDGALSALGFVLFGDQLLAWHWYSLLYLVGIAVAGMAILRHSSGMAGALVFPMLLAAAPFLIKDGLITPMGHHATGPFFALAALAVALGGRGRGPDGSGPRTLTVGRAFAAGLVLGVGCWYMRTVIAAAPALALAVLPGGRRALGAAAAGFMAYPILTGINCWFFTQHVDPYTEWGFWTTLGASMASPRALAAAVDPVSKSMEALALPFRHLLFAQPFCLERDLHPRWR